MIKAIIFDADGMILDQERLSVFLPRDYGMKAEDINAFFHGPFQECLVGKVDLKEILPPYLSLWGWGWGRGLDAFLHLWFDRGHKVNAELVDYIRGTRQAGILCLLATNQEKYRFQYMLDQIGLAQIFDKAYTSAHLGYKKPKPEFFIKIMADFKNIKREEVLFWDDRPENVKGAADFGFNAELYTSLADFKEKMSKYLA